MISLTTEESKAIIKEAVRLQYLKLMNNYLFEKGLIQERFYKKLRLAFILEENKVLERAERLGSETNNALE